MCGIVGVLDSERAARRFEASLQRAANSIAHRGPNDSGKYFDGPIGIGFRRLSILDLSSGGHQPMASGDGRWVLAFNGEVYNFLELREELRASGVAFRSECDTEVLVEAIAHWGPVEALARCNGMWALLAWDRQSGSLLATRDPWGIKPLYLSHQEGWIGFGSEVKALATLGCDLGGVDAVAAARFVDWGILDADERTMFSRVKRVEPGVLYRFRETGSSETERYGDGTEQVDVPDVTAGAQNESEFVAAFREAFLDSVRIRLRADVPVGTSLSGGLDSTAVAGATAQILEGHRISPARHAFTASFEEYDESSFIEPLVRGVGIDWHVTKADESTFLDSTESFFRVHDEPVHSLSPLAGFIVMGLADEQGVRVLLNGQGSDELLAGYSSSINAFLRSVRSEKGWWHAFQEAVAESNGDRARGFKRLMRASSARLARVLPRLMTSRLAPDPASLGTSLLSPDFSGSDWHANMALGLQETLYLSRSQHPLPLYLRIEDANSSAFSLEARLPFLDPRVVAFAQSAPASMLRRGGLNKYLLRAMLPGLVPEVILNRRDKMGFPVPHGRWLRGSLKPLLLDTLSRDRLRARGWYDVDAVGRHVDDLLKSDARDVSPGLTRALILERWARERLDVFERLPRTTSSR